MNKLYIPDSYTPAISIEQYRTNTGDHTSADELIMQRIFCIERLCLGVIIQELRKVNEVSE